MPAAAEDNLSRVRAHLARARIRAWAEGWWEMPVTVGDQLGRILGAPSGSIVMHQNVTVAEAIVLSCFDAAGRGTGSSTRRRTSRRCAYLYQAQPELEVVAVDDDAAIVDAIDERTLLVPISHVLFKNGEIQDVEPIVRRAREAGAHVVLDCYQSAGVVPFDLTELGRPASPSAAASSGSAGGRAPAGSMCGRTSPERLSPRSSGGRGTRGRSPSSRSSEYAAGARRFLTGTPNRPRALRGDRRLRRDRGGRRAADPRALARAHAAR